jgi:hypothetical protein
VSPSFGLAIIGLFDDGRWAGGQAVPREGSSMHDRAAQPIPVCLKCIWKYGKTL